MNWQLPRFLRAGRHDHGKAAPEFPPVPTRWLVSRYAAGTPPTLQKQWIVLSDVVAGRPGVGEAQTSLEVDIYSGTRPYSTMGRTFDLTHWKSGPQLPSGDTTWKATHGGKPLTALGWGSPAFDVFYPDCHGVFGFHDTHVTPLDGSTFYVVIGWYGDPADDWWKHVLADDDPGKKPPGLDKLTHLSQKRRDKLHTESVKSALADLLGISIARSAGQKLWEILPKDGMLCYGKVELEEPLAVPPSPAAPPPPAAASVAIGNSPTEALSALIVAETDPGATGVERQKLEDTFSAALLGDRLESVVLDVGPAYRDLRHEQEFLGRQGGTVWRIRRDAPDQLDVPGQSPPPEPVAPSGSAGPPPDPTLPAAVAPLLDALNQAQADYDRAAFALGSRHAELYADWWRYMHCAYPPAGETESYLDPGLVTALIRDRSLLSFTLLAEVISPPLDPSDMRPPTGPTVGALVTAVYDAWQALDHKLGEINQANALSTETGSPIRWVLQPVPGPRFWEPAAPAVVLAFPKGTLPEAPEPPHPGPPEEAAPLAGLLPCTVFAGSVNFAPGSSFDVGALLSKVLDLTRSAGAPGRTIADNQPRNVFRVEWQAEVYPQAAARRSADGFYDPDFILDNYLLGENSPDLSDSQGLGGPVSVERTGSVYAGRCYSNLRVGARYGELLDAFLDIIEKDTGPRAAGFKAKVTQAKTFLEHHDLVALTLDGFNSALLQRHETRQLHIADPLGFEDQVSFAREVAAAIPPEKGKAYAPDPFAELLPIRSGALRLATLRLVDSFGRFRDISPAAVHRVLPMQVPSHPDWVRLPPRLSQAARFQLAFLQDENGEVAAADDLPEHSPICGWVVPNLLDRSLVLFTAGGQYAGTIPQNIGPNSPSEAGSSSVTPVLFRVSQWIADQSSSGTFLDDLIDAVERSLDNIHPADRRGQTAYSVLLGRPMALVRVGVRLELEGDPAFDLSWNALRRDVTRVGRETAGYEQVKFPYRLGEYRQLEDGLVGFWTYSAAGGLGQELFVSDSVSATVQTIPPDSELNLPPWLQEQNEAWKELVPPFNQTLLDYLRPMNGQKIKKQDLIQPYVRQGGRTWGALVEYGWLTPETVNPAIKHYADDRAFSMTVDAPLREHVCLLDPLGALHLSSGIQPVKAVRLPVGYYREALKRIEISFLTAPLLTPETALHVSLPREPRFVWSWQEANAWGRGEAEVIGPPPPLPQSEIRPFVRIADFPDRVVAREGRLSIRQGEQPTLETPATPPAKEEL